MKPFLRLLLLLTPLLVLLGCKEEHNTTIIQAPATDPLREQFALVPLGPIDYPPDNPPMQERITLGRLLFFDPILGGELDVSCATCHHPDFAFGDGRQLPIGVAGGRSLGPTRTSGSSRISGAPVGFTPRNAPTCFNTAYNADEHGVHGHNGFQFWDGRVKSLEVQATKPITSRVEMRGDAYPGDDDVAGATSLDSVLNRLRAIDEYVALFMNAFPQEHQEWQMGLREHVVDSSTYGRSIGAYERELVTRNSAYDRYADGDDHALTNSQKRGLELFFTTAKCSQCHPAPVFSNYEFTVQGAPQIGPGKAIIPGDDLGRCEFTLNPGDNYAFRTPTLRNVELTAPYMHDGVFGSLEEVVQFYNHGCQPRHPQCPDEAVDSLVRDPLNLTDGQVEDLVSFLKALTDPGTALPQLLLTVPERVPSGLTPVFGLSADGGPFAEPPAVEPRDKYAHVH
ncbi:cytochrome-c peroxidase [candidate division KSB1 bacterium]|nr:cytochrome-c peroxidase [candidate division KSB1 bacterium]